jgi:hypothetical protein
MKGPRGPSNAMFPTLSNCGTLLTKKYQQPQQHKRSALTEIKGNKVGFLMLHPKTKTKILMLLFSQQLT